jgi:16S rRNA processing protein RimM
MPVHGGTKAGRISKPNGLQGDVNIIMDPAAGKNIKTDHPLFIDIDGQRVPFFVEDSEKVTPKQVIVKFEFVNGVEEARRICGCDVYFDDRQPVSTADRPSDYQDLVGFDAYDRVLGQLGPVKEFLPHENNPLFLLEKAGKELMIPASGAFITKIDHTARTVHFDLPQGLTDL